MRFLARWVAERVRHSMHSPQPCPAARLRLRLSWVPFLPGPPPVLSAALHLGWQAPALEALLQWKMLGPA